MSLFLQVLGMVFIAEMGDKSQFLMIAMASKYKLRSIIIGAAAAILVLNALAIGLGAFLGNILPTAAINLAAGAAFLVFAYMTIGGEEEDECVDCKNKYGAILTVFGTFFLAELGDKTQLAALTLAADSTTGGFDMTKVLFVFFGASLALFAADIIGLLVGYFLGKTLPTSVFSWISVAIFAVFGVLKLLSGFEGVFKTIPNARILSIALTSALAIAFVVMGVLKLAKKPKCCGCGASDDEE